MTTTARPLLLIFAFVLVLTACKPGLTPQKLYGTWKYTKLENPRANPPSTEPDWKLKMEDPSIVFSTDNKLTIWWDKKVLAQGTFKVDGEKILVNETLPDGNTRAFPFYVLKFDEKQIVFETLGIDGTRVTAVKQ